MQKWTKPGGIILKDAKVKMWCNLVIPANEPKQYNEENQHRYAGAPAG